MYMHTQDASRCSQMYMHTHDASRCLSLSVCIYVYTGCLSLLDFATVLRNIHRDGQRASLNEHFLPQVCSHTHAHSCVPLCHGVI